MGSLERSKKRVHLCKKAVVHFMLCFVMGFFTGFMPTSKPSIFSTNRQLITPTQSEFSPQPTEMPHQHNATLHAGNRSLIAQTQVGDSENTKLLQGDDESDQLVPRRHIIIITPLSMKSQSKGVILLRRLANTLRLVPPPLLWITVQAHSDSSEVPEILRKTGIMYRHLVYKENFTDPEAEMDHQRNVALNHIEHHRLSGIVHFAGLSNVYDLSFFDEIRDIEVFGTWPMALVSANKKRVIIEGPVCDSSQVIGWHTKKMKNEEDAIFPIHVSSFAFNSSILWDPERWGRSSSIQDNSQNSIKFVKQMVLEDETKLKGIPPESCSKVLLWHLNFPTSSNHLP